MHPLKGPARWGILPGLSAVAGVIAGVVVLGVTSNQVSGDVVSSGAILGAASALAVSLTPKPWLRVLIAPAAGLLGVMLFTVILVFPASPLRALEGAFAPMVHLLVLLTTAPMVVLHGMRMKREASWRLPFLALAGAVGLATGLTLGEAFYRSQAYALTVFCVLLNVGCAVALEVALRLSRRSPG